MSNRSPENFRDETSPETRGVAGMIRRMAISLTRAVLWQLTGHSLLDGSIETHDAPVFGGIGRHARPPDSGNPEAIVVFPGGASNALIAALRDEATRAAVFAAIGELQADETCEFNSKSIFLIKADGTVEVRSLAGVAVPLATKAELQALRDYVNNQFSSTNGHTHVVAGAATTTITAVAVPGIAPTVAPANPIGTTKLRAE